MHTMHAQHKHTLYLPADHCSVLLQCAQSFALTDSGHHKNKIQHGMLLIDDIVPCNVESSSPAAPIVNSGALTLPAGVHSRAPLLVSATHARLQNKQGRSGSCYCITDWSYRDELTLTTMLYKRPLTPTTMLYKRSFTCAKPAASYVWKHLKQRVQ
jgi:hypothetical protein